MTKLTKEIMFADHAKVPFFVQQNFQLQTIYWQREIDND